MALSKRSILVVANRTADSPDLIEALCRRAAEAPTRFTLLVPAVPHGLAWAADMKAGWSEAALRADRAGRRIRRSGLELEEVIVGDGDRGGRAAAGPAAAGPSGRPADRGLNSSLHAFFQPLYRVFAWMTAGLRTVPPTADARRRWWPPSIRTVKWAAFGAIALVLLIQLVPYGRAHTNPPVTQAAKWPPGPGQQVAEAGCYDCHSNLTKWRWYSNVAPASWLVEHDVEDGRGILNFSEWNKPQPDAGELIEKVESGEMPPLQYKLAHGSARLSSKEKKQLVAAITRLYATDPPPAGGGG